MTQKIKDLLVKDFTQKVDNAWHRIKYILIIEIIFL